MSQSQQGRAVGPQGGSCPHPVPKVVLQRVLPPTCLLSLIVTINVFCPKQWRKVRVLAPSVM